MANNPNNTNNGNIGNAVHILAPGTTWKLHNPGTQLSNLEWLDDPALRPSDAAILAKTAEIDALPVFPPPLMP